MTGVIVSSGVWNLPWTIGTGEIIGEDGDSSRFTTACLSSTTGDGVATDREICRHLLFCFFFAFNVSDDADDTDDTDTAFLLTRAFISAGVQTGCTSISTFPGVAMDIDNIDLLKQIVSVFLVAEIPFD